MTFELVFVKKIDTSPATVPSGLVYGGDVLYMGAFASSDANLYSVNTSTGAVTAVTTMPSAVDRPENMAYNSGQIWALDSGNVAIWTVATDSWSSVFDIEDVGANELISSISHDGTNVWSFDWNQILLNRYRPSDMVLLESIDMSGTFLDGQTPEATIIDGNFWWATIDSDIKIQNVSSKALLDSIDDPLKTQIASNASTISIASDGTNVWLIPNSTSNTSIYEYRFAIPTLYVSNTGFRFPYQRWD